MKKFNSIELLDQLQSDVRQMILRVNQLKSADPGVLLEQPAPGKWSVVEILEHLNSYNLFYNPALEKSLEADKPAVALFKSGWIGNYFTNMMKPTETGKVKNKMKAPRGHRPCRLLDAQPVINSFLTYQHQLLDLLEAAKQKDIGSLCTPISLTKLIKLKTGDVFRFLIAHEQRHFVQLENALLAIREIRPGKYPTALPVM
ncbi:MAG TPA: DinB family protein [Chitinophagaceae bacterium]|nr:DinB family protein [Chitinophagaceae bacterium]